MDVDTEGDVRDASLAILVSAGASSTSSVPVRMKRRPKSSADNKGAKKIGHGVGMTGESPITAGRSPPSSLPFEPFNNNATAATTAVTTAATTTAAAAAATSTAAAAATCPATTIVAAGYSAVTAELSAIRMSVNEAVLKGGMSAEASMGVLVATNRYDELVMALAGDKVRLEERAR